MRKKLISVALSVVVMLGSAGGASALEAAPSLVEQMPAVSSDSLDTTNIEARDNQIRQIIRPAVSGDKDQETLEKELAAIGVVGFKDLTPKSFSTRSYTNSMELKVFSTYDSQQHQQVIIGTYFFKDDAVLTDGNCGPGPQMPCEVGGEDVFGLSFSKDLPVVSSIAYHCSDGQGYDCTSIDSPYIVNQKGVAWKFQDVIYGVDSKYNMRAGDFYFRTGDICSFQAFASYTHTWDNAEISSITLGWGTLGVITTNSDKSWTKAVSGPPTSC